MEYSPAVHLRWGLPLVWPLILWKQGGGVAGGAFIRGGENGRLGALDYQKMGPQTLPCMGQGAAGLGINTTGM